MGDGGRVEPHALLNSLSTERARRALATCCGATRWVDGMLERRPFPSSSALFEAADLVWSKLDGPDFLEAFTHHPEIGANIAELRKKFQPSAALSEREQAGVAEADEETLLSLRDGNRAYKERFGYIFIVCATGKSAKEMLDLLSTRLPNQPDRELAIAAGEQAKITRLRLEKLAR